MNIAFITARCGSKTIPYNIVYPKNTKLIFPLPFFEVITPVVD